MHASVAAFGSPEPLGHFRICPPGLKIMPNTRVQYRSRVVQPSSQSDFAENKALKRNSSDRMLGIARILGVQRTDLSEGVFVDVELFDLQF